MRHITGNDFRRRSSWLSYDFTVVMVVFTRDHRWNVWSRWISSFVASFLLGYSYFLALRILCGSWDPSLFAVFQVHQQTQKKTSLHDFSLRYDEFSRKLAKSWRPFCSLCTARFQNLMNQCNIIAICPFVDPSGGFTVFRGTCFRNSVENKFMFDCRLWISVTLKFNSLPFSCLCSLKFSDTFINTLARPVRLGNI